MADCVSLPVFTFAMKWGWFESLLISVMMVVRMFMLGPLITVRLGCYLILSVLLQKRTTLQGISLETY